MAPAIRAFAHPGAHGLDCFLQDRAANLFAHADRQGRSARQQGTLAVLNAQRSPRRQLYARNRVGHPGQIEGGVHHPGHLVIRAHDRQRKGQNWRAGKPSDRIGAHHKAALGDGIAKIGAITQKGFLGAPQRVATGLSVQPQDAEIGVFGKMAGQA